jgi:hypothetical protein
MRTALVTVVLICSFAMGLKETDVNGDMTLLPDTWSGSSGKGADVLFLFLAYDNYNPDTIYACGDSYWNPAFEQSGSGWALNSISGSWAEPSGSPYHWHGGLGSAISALGLSWEWFPGYTGRCGQVIPDAGTLSNYDCLFILTFDAYRSVVLTSTTRSILDTYMENDGHVVLISQDALFSGVPESWLDSWFDCGSIQQDVYGGASPFPAFGLPSSFMIGWAGTALMENFSTGAGGHSEGLWWPDYLSGNGCIGDGPWIYSSFSDINGSIFSTFDFETCSPEEVQSICEQIMNWMQGTALERSTWGSIKADY